MSRLTITLPEARCRALKEAAAKRGRTIDQLVEESLEFERSGLSEGDALALAVEQAKQVRRGA